MHGCGDSQTWIYMYIHVHVLVGTCTCTMSVWHSKSLEKHCQRTACLWGVGGGGGAEYIQGACALILTKDGCFGYQMSMWVGMRSAWHSNSFK